MATPEKPERDIVSEIRVTARHLANASASDERTRSPDLQLEIARLTAGDDPACIDTTSPEYRAGAALALSVALNGLRERIVPRGFTQ